MRTDDDSKFSFLLIGLGLAAIGGLMAALLGRKETREYLRERSAKGLDILNQQAGKLREGAEGMVQRGKEIMSRHCCDSVDTDMEAEKKVYEKEGRETLGG
jgi:gas vesicle protein